MERISTGIKDKNGKEIFVDDLVRTYTGEIIANFYGNERVICENGKFYLENEDGISFFDDAHTTVEVIGNIKDTPTLFREGFRMTFWDD